jgi:hypothetical protein
LNVIRRRLKNRQSVENEIGMGLDLVRMPVSALRPGPRIALFCIEGAIADRARRANAKPLSISQPRPLADPAL